MFIFGNHLISVRVMTDPEHIPGTLCARREYIVDGMTVLQDTVHRVANPSTGMPVGIWKKSTQGELAKTTSSD